MKRTLTRSWERVRTPDGRLYYVTHISDYFMVQVWREGASWHWVAVGFMESFGLVPLIAKHGTAGTMNEAQWYAEQWIPVDADEQLLWLP